MDYQSFNPFFTLKETHVFSCVFCICVLSIMSHALTSKMLTRYWLFFSHSTRRWSGRCLTLKSEKRALNP